MKQQLYKKLVEEFNLRGTPLNTRKTYTYCIGRFERHFGSGAAQLGREHVRRYLLHLVEHEHLSAQTHNVHAAALWFLYTKVLERPKVVADLPRRKQTRTLPTVLTPDEVARLFTALGATALRAVLMLAYGAGLRIGEACRLRMQDINSRAGVIHVRSTKRNRDRDVRPATSGCDLLPPTRPSPRTTCSVSREQTSHASSICSAPTSERCAPSSPLPSPPESSSWPTCTWSSSPFR